MRRKADQAQATRQSILKVARSVFTERGYADAATDEIAEKAGVTRGALYHHFRDKKDVFALVYEILQREIYSRILEATSAESDVWKRLTRACHVYLDASLDPAVQRIVLLEAPRVFSRRTLSELQAVTGPGLIGPGLMRMFLQELMDTGVIFRQNAWSLSILISGALDAAALEIATAPDKAMWRRELGLAVDNLLDRLRISKNEKDSGWRQPRPRSQGKGKSRH
jgi:AcrR family transcriptional regulator